MSNLKRGIAYFMMNSGCLSSSGSPAEFIVNTTNAGPGALAITIDGPSKVKMDCQECPEGYKVIYTPMAPGSYLISIKYGGPYHIAGSPFKARITGEQHVRLGRVKSGLYVRGVGFPWTLLNP